MCGVCLLALGWSKEVYAVPLCTVGDLLCAGKAHSLLLCGCSCVLGSDHVSGPLCNVLVPNHLVFTLVCRPFVPGLVSLFCTRCSVPSNMRKLYLT